MAPLLLFVFAGLFSPGPNVILLTMSGMRFGFSRTVPHILGVALGVGGIAAITAMGLGFLLQSVPALNLVLKAASAVWILYLAYRLWTADPGKASGQDTPFTFRQAVLFQLVNPKIWSVAFAAMAYVSDLSIPAQVMTLAVTFSGLNLGVCVFWTFIGTKTAYVLSNPKARNVVMRMMAILLAVSVGLLFL